MRRAKRWRTEVGGVREGASPLLLASPGHALSTALRRTCAASFRSAAMELPLPWVIIASIRVTLVLRGFSSFFGTGKRVPATDFIRCADRNINPSPS